MNVPLVGSVATPEVNNTNSSLPIFNSTFETREPINNVLPDYSMSDSKVGYFLRDGKLHTGYLSPIGKVNGVEIYITKVPNITKGFGNQPAHVASNDFYAVFPNGNTIALVKNAVPSYSETEAKNNIKKILEGNPKRVVDMSQESTILQNLAPSTYKSKLESLLDIFIPLPKEKSPNYELNLNTANRRRGNIIKGEEDLFPTDKSGNPKTIDWYITQIEEDLNIIEALKLVRKKRALETKGELSQDEALRGPEAFIATRSKNISRHLANAFYLINNESVLFDTDAVPTVSAASVNTKKMLLPKVGKNVTGYLYNTENIIPVIYVKTPNNNTAQIEWDNSRKRWGMLILTSEGVGDAIMDFNMTFDTIREFVHENLDKKFTDLFESGEAEKLNNEDARNNTTKLDEALAVFDIKFTHLSMSDYNASTTVETPATINQGESNGAASTVAKEQTINQTDEEFDVEFELRQVDDLSRPVWDKDKELAWLKRVLPQLSENELVKIQEGLIEVAKTGALAWGQFSRGVITLSDIAAEGTTYHEAFHAVFNLLTDTETREALYAEARQKFGNRDNAELEELMAEDFREYVMTQEDRGLGRKLLDFFKSLFAKVTNWKSIQPSLIQYYRNINEGHYSNITYKVPSLQEIRNQEGVQSSMDFSSIETETREALEKKGWTEEMWNQISQEEREQAIRCS